MNHKHANPANSFCFRNLILVTLFLISLKTTFAANEIFNVRRSITSTAAQSPILVYDDKYPVMLTNMNWPLDFTNHKLINRIKMGVNHASPNIQNAAPFSVTVNFNVIYYTYNQGTHTFDANTTPATSLTVDYSNNTASYDLSVFQFAGGNLMQINITSVTTTGGAPATFDFYLEGEIEAERYYNLSYPNFPALTNQLLTPSDELEIRWNYVYGAEQYELEWTYVNNYDAAGGNLNPASIPFKPVDEFKYNSTRITTTNNFYRIPVLYERGYLVYRIRAVGKQPSGSPVNFDENYFTKWCDDGSTATNLNAYIGAYPTHAYQINAHQSNLNWQKSVTFAEEGKNKIAISYFDGSLRSRQTVSKSNTDKNTIVGETIYDHQGRGAVQALPVPTTINKIQFNPNFNRNTSATAYDRENFDFDSGNCLPTAEPMPATSGASNYYSPSNTNKEGQQAFVPDAKEFPFTQVQYTPDNTGRISSQSGVGPFHKLGSGHETQYVYGKPWQEELDVLFGSEVGDALHYKKNVVIDPNRQISVSYLDPQGRVVATALAGNSPGNVDPIPTTPINMNIDLLNKVHPTDNTGSQNILNLTNRSLTMNTQVTPTTDGVVTFDYDMHGQEFNNECDPAKCYDCVFDLQITMTDECGEEHFPSLPAATGVVPHPDGSVTIGPAGNVCGPVNPSYTQTGMQTVIPGSTTVGPVGPPHNYTLNKVLTVNQTILDQYTYSYLNNPDNPCILHLSDFIAEQMENIDTTGCNMTCEECLAQLGDYSQYDINKNPQCDPCYSQMEYDEQVAECNEMCSDQLMDCEAGYAMMLADVSPMGQYGEIMATPVNPDSGTPNNFSVDPTPAIDVCPFPLSVFNHGLNEGSTTCTHNLLPYKNGHQPDWKNPIRIQPGQTNGPAGYLDENGNPATVEVEPDPNNPGGFIPPVDNNSSPVLGGDGVWRVAPERLLKQSDFVANFDQSWANSLVYYHPEWCYYEFCTGLNESNTFDSHWLTTDNIADAQSAFGSFLSSTSYNVNNDPFFSMNAVYGTQLPANKNFWMTAFMNQYNTNPPLNIWQMAYITANCPDPDPACYCNPPANVTLTTDQEWMFFKNFYMGLKQKIRDYSATRYAITNGCYNGCIGNDHFNPFDDGFYQSHYPVTITNPWWGWLGLWWNHTYTYWRSQYFNGIQPCNWMMHNYYADKTKRFPRMQDMMDGNNLNLNLDAVTCYNLSNPPSPDDYNNPVNCPEQNAAIVNALQEEADWALYQQCHQCPVAFDLQNFLNAIATNDDLADGHNITVSCPAPNGSAPQYLEFVPDLETAMFGTTDGDVSWTTNITPVTGGSEAVIIFTNTTVAQPCTLKLFFPTTQYHDLYDNTPTGTYNWIDINTLCCLDANAGTHYLPNSNFTFTIKAKVINPTTGLSEDIVLDGTSCVQVEGCTFPVRCHVNQTGIDVMNLFNSLLINPVQNPVFPTVPKTDFLTSIQIGGNPPAAPYDAFMTTNITNGLIASLGGVATDAWSWRYLGLVGADYVWGIYRPGVNDPCEFHLLSSDLQNAGITPNEIISFSNIRPDKNSADPSHNFLITAYVIDAGTTPKFVVVHGYSECFNIGECGDNLNSALYNTEPPNQNGHDASPGFDDVGNGGPVFPLQKGIAVVTNVAYGGYPTPAFNSSSFTIYDLRHPAVNGALIGQNWACPHYHDPAWDLSAVGPMFGVTTDNETPPNIYVASSTAYGNGLSSSLSNVWKVNGNTGAIAQLCSQAACNLTSAGIGNICFDKNHNVSNGGQLFFTNHADGKIYRVDINGNLLSVFTPSTLTTTFSASSGYVSLGKRLWGINVLRNRIYFSRWAEDAGTSRNSLSVSNEIYYVDIDPASGDFSGVEHLVITLPPHTSGYSNPVSDITFFSDCKMILAERGMNYDNSPTPHQGRILEYLFDGINWVPSPIEYTTGWIGGTNAAGGVAYTKGGEVWATADAMANVSIYGMQYIPPVGNGAPNYTMNSYYVDINNYVAASPYQDKTQIGDIKIFGIEPREECSDSCGIELLGNGNFEQGNSGFISPNYTYIATCPSTNSYTVTADATALCVGNSFNRQGQDHTSPGLPGVGNFGLFVENFNVNPSVMWTNATSPITVAPNTDYSFSIWYMATDNGDGLGVRNIFLSVNGNQLTGTYTPVPSTVADIGVWKQITGVWNSGSNTSATLSISLDHTFGREHGIGLDDISFQHACETGLPSLLCDPTPFPSVTIEDPCVAQMVNLALSNAQTLYDEYIEHEKESFQEAYIQKCLDVYEGFQMRYEDKQHHYTLYYYDQGGNLVRTIPPAGVQKITDPLKLAQVKIDRATNARNVFTEHALPTTYKYNSLNQLVYQSVPDNNNMNIWSVNNSSSGIPTNVTIYQSQFCDPLHGYSVGEYPAGVGHVYVTSDGGITWTEITAVGLANINDVGFEPGTNIAYAVMSDGKALIYNGTTWNVLTVGTNNSLIKIAVTGVGQFFAFEATGKTWYTNNSGATFSVVSTPSIIGNLTGVSFYNATDGYATTSGAAEGRIYSVSFDGINTLTWTLSPSISTADLNSVQFISALNGFAVGKDGTLVICTNGIWREAITTFVGASQAQELKRIHFKNLSDGWAIDAAGYLYTIHLNANNEATLTKIITTNTFSDFSFYQLDAGFALSATPTPAKIYEWTSGGSTTPTLQTIPGLPTAISAIDFTDVNHGFVATNGTGTVSKLTRVGVTWSVAALPGAAMGGSGNITQLHFRINGANSYGAAIRNAVTYYYSSTSWATSGISNAKQFSFYGPQDGLLLTNANEIKNTTNTGQSWSTAIYTLPAGTFNSISFSDGVNGTVVGNGGNIQSIVAGVGPTAHTNNIIPSPLNDVSAFGITDAYIAGKGGTVLTFDNSIPGWKTLITGTNAELRSLDHSSAGNGSIGGKAGTALKFNGSSVTTGTGLTDDIVDVANRNSTGNFASVGNNITNQGLEFNSGNGGSSYTASLSNPFSTASLSAVSFKNANNGFAVGSNGKIFESVNGGVNWNASNSITPPVFASTCIAPGSSCTSYGVGYGVVYQSTDGGLSWHPQTITPAIPTTHLYSVHFYDATHGYAVGEAGKVIQTNDGINWSVVSIGATVNLNDVFCVSANNVWIVGNTGRVYHYTGTWNALAPLSFIGVNQNLNAVYFVDASFGYIAGNGGALFKYFSGNWVADRVVPSNIDWVTTPGNYGTGNTSDLKDVYFYDYLTGYAVGTNNVILKTTSGGAINSTGTPPNPGLWVKKSNWVSGHTIYAATFIDDGHAYFSGNTTVAPPLNNGQILTDYSDRFASRFWYDKLGRLVASQNTKQYNKSPQAFSYTKYDALGRILEVGELASATEPTTALINAVNYPDNWNTTRTEVTRTYYDHPLCFNSSGAVCTDITNQFGTGGQLNLRNRVSSCAYYPLYVSTTANIDLTYDHATHYSYDIHGNVNLLVQDNQLVRTTFPAQEFKKVYCAYDLISGKVNKVDYQPGQPDEMHHRYEYDADNRITNVITSKDGVIWDNDAKYFYYLHGPLARTEIGDQKVTATDYAYTLQGWIKGVNSNTLVKQRDQGKDGVDDSGSGSYLSTQPDLHKWVGVDQYGYTLGYFNKRNNDASNINNSYLDYYAISQPTTLNNFEASLLTNNGTANSQLRASTNDLYNGNISHSVTALSALSGNPLAYGYQYDQLNRLVQATSYNNVDVSASAGTGNTWSNAGAPLKDYNMHLTYDANGNILTLDREGNLPGAAKDMDQMQYQYDYSGLNGKLRSNKLYHVNDNTALTANYTVDIDDQGAFTSNPTTINSVNNYSYDDLGNLIKDEQEQIRDIKWTVYGKIQKIIRKTTSTKEDLEFKYDATGNRIEKIVKPHGMSVENGGVDKPNEWITTYYTRDASGNIMADYTSKSDGNVNTDDQVFYYLAEHDLYGSSRLGIMTRNLNLSSYVPTPNKYKRHLGDKQYELTNHLGNVQLTLFDIKEPHNGGGNIIDYYTAVKASAQDYYPFGMLQPGRSFASAGYRFGYNGKEEDDEVKGAGNSLDFGVRTIYDPRLGRFTSVDPNFRGLPSYSPYQYARNNPIMLKENGKDGVIPTWLWKSGLVSPFAAGFIDAIADDVKGLWDVGVVLAAFNPSGIYFWTSSAEQVRAETYNTASTILDIMTNPVLRTIVMVNMYESAKSTVENADLKDAEYATGYVAWNVLSFFIGVGEVSAFAKTGKMGVTMEKFMGLIGKSADQVDHLANIVRRSAMSNINKIEWHHLIPDNLIENPVVKKAIKGGYKFNERMENLVPLEKYLKKNGQGVHGNAPKYDDQIKGAISRFEQMNPGYNESQAKSFLDDLRTQILEKIDGNPSTKLNDLNLDLKVKKY